MKNLATIAIVIASLMALQSCSSTALKSLKAENKTDSVSYMIGISVGHSLKAQNIPDISAELILKGITEVLENDSAMGMQEANMFLQQYFSQLAQRKAQENMEKGQEFLEENKTMAGVVETESGLQYKVIEEGTGKMPTENDKVKCHYRGRLLDGTEFDSSYKTGKPYETGLKRVIKGWTEGLQLMKEGGKYELYVPGHLAYGPRGGGGVIGPNETLIFEIELLEIVSE